MPTFFLKFFYQNCTTLDQEFFNFFPLQSSSLALVAGDGVASPSDVATHGERQPTPGCRARAREARTSTPQPRRRLTGTNAEAGGGGRDQPGGGDGGRDRPRKGCRRMGPIGKGRRATPGGTGAGWRGAAGHTWSRRRKKLRRLARFVTLYADPRIIIWCANFKDRKIQPNTTFRKMEGMFGSQP